MGFYLVLFLAVLGLLGSVKEVTPQAVAQASYCWTDLECSSTPNAVCLPDQDGVLRCSCAGGYFNESGKCTMRKLGDTCANDTDCSLVISFSFCPQRAKKCRCGIGYKRVQSICIPLEIGDRCRRKGDCQLVISNSFCSKRIANKTDRTCECEEDYFPVLSGGRKICQYSKKIGSECKTTEECQKISSNIECQKEHCVCQAGYKPSGTISCVHRVLNDVCSKSVDCAHIPFSSCQNISDISTCLCKSGYRSEADNLACSPRQINDTCETDADCEMIDGFCNEDKVCSCQKGHKPSDNLDLSVCERQQIREVPCTTDTVCTSLFNNTACDTQSKYCKCKSRYIEAADGFVCFFRHLEEICRRDADCTYSVSDSHCINQACTCRPHFTPSSDQMMCHLQIIGGKNCTSNDTCLGLVKHSFCDINIFDNGGSCACQVGYRVEGDFDHCREIKLEEKCTSDEECLVTNPYSWCDPFSQKCQCTISYSMIPSWSQTSKAYCQKRRIGQHQCKTTAHCTSAVLNSQCQSCEKNSMVPECRRACVDQTSGGCDASTCQCKTGYYAVKAGRFCQGRQLFELCKVDEDCSGHMPQTRCNGGMCDCRSGFKQTGPASCAKRNLGDECNLDSDCVDAVNNTKCFKDFDENDTYDKGNCVCTSGYVMYSNDSACRRRQIGENNCLVDKDCSDAVADSYCRNGMCVCLPGFHPSASLYKCNKRQLNNHLCSLHKDCNASVANSECKDHVCRCKSGFAQTDGECVRRRIEDFGCRIEKDCSDAVANSTCNFGYCLCVTGYQSQSNGTSCMIRKVGDETCIADMDCSSAVSDSMCEEDTCVCVSGFYASQDMSSCIKRKIGDSCTNFTDCYDVIANSDCVNETCECDLGYDVHENNTQCFPRPGKIGLPCISTYQCQLIHNDSICHFTVGTNEGKCVCSNSTFVDKRRQECVPNPKRVGDRCEKTRHCLIHLDNSNCENRGKTCKCQPAHFVDQNGTLCHPYPKQLTERCTKKGHCRKISNKAECDLNNNTCICQYGYTQNSSTVCIERPRLPTLKIHKRVPDAAECKEKCEKQNNTICVSIFKLGPKYCRCNYRYAKPYMKKDCVATQTYLIKIYLVREFGVYDFLPLEFKPQYISHRLPAYKKFAQRVTLNGIKDLMESSAMNQRFISSEVLRANNPGELSNVTDAGVEVLLLLHLAATQKYYHATSPQVLYRNILRQITESQGELGTSKLIVEMPYSKTVSVTDFDECGNSEYNDCSTFATCINTVGSYMCVCKSTHIDISHSKNKLRGRVCKEPKPGDGDDDECLSRSCETRWLFVGLALTLVMVVVFSFITYEIIQHKQSFNAKKLYEKFGTTKIRHLKKATLRRIQENKKKKKKRKKKGKNKTKEGSKSDDERESNVLTPTSLNTEDVPPSPVGIIHTPSLPIEIPFSDRDDKPFEDPEAGLDFIDIDSPGETTQL